LKRGKAFEEGQIKGQKSKRKGQKYEKTEKAIQFLGISSNPN
jgi:hypothetical protein